MTCQFCGSAIHVWWDCPKKPDGWKPQLKSAVQLVTARNVAQSEERSDKAADPVINGKVAGSRPAVGHRKVAPMPSKLGRPRNGFDKAAYNRDYMRKRRAAAKEGK